MTRPSTIAVIGSGRLARFLVPALDRAGQPVVAVAARTRSSARAIARRAPGALATIDIVRAASAAQTILLAVSDRAIAGLADDLARSAEFDPSGKVVLHHAGSLGPEALVALSRGGAEVGVLHPLQTFGSSTRRNPTLPEGTRARIEGSPIACRRARGLARALGLSPLAGGVRWTPERRALYHAAASMASNDLVALLHHAIEAMTRAAGVGPDAARSALLPLVQGTLRQLENGGVEGALAGPAVRGDRETLAGHGRALAAGSPEAAEVHRCLSATLERLAGVDDADAGGRAGVDDADAGGRAGVDRDGADR